MKPAKSPLNTPAPDRQFCCRSGLSRATVVCSVDATMPMNDGRQWVSMVQMTRMPLPSLSSHTSPDGFSMTSMTVRIIECTQMTGPSCWRIATTSRRSRSARAKYPACRSFPCDV